METAGGVDGCGDQAGEANATLVRSSSHASVRKVEAHNDNTYIENYKTLINAASLHNVYVYLWPSRETLWAVSGE